MRHCPKPAVQGFLNALLGQVNNGMLTGLDVFRQDFEKAGMTCSGINPDNGLVEIVEVPSCRWYVGVQFHPEYSGTVLHPNPLFVSFVGHMVLNKKE